MSEKLKRKLFEICGMVLDVLAIITILGFFFLVPILFVALLIYLPDFF